MTRGGSDGVFKDAAQLRALMDSAVDGIITIDDQGVIESANPAAERLFGYTVAEMVGQNIRMLMPSPYREDHDGYLANYMRTGEKRIIGTGREVTGLRKDGSTFSLYLAVSETQLGDRRVFTGSLHDLTDLKEAEERATRFGRILEDSLNEIFVFDVETLRFLHVNKGALRNTGYSVEEIAELTPLDIKPDFGEARFRELLEPLTAGRKSVLQFETIHQRRDGTHYNVLVRLHCAEWQGRAAFVAIILDITERVQRDEELRIRNQAIQSAIEGIVITDATKDEHPIVFVNPAFEALSGYTAGDAIGQSWTLLCEGVAESPQLLSFRQAMSDYVEFRTTIECVRADGERFWNDVSIAPVRSSTGVVTHNVVVMVDVSDRRQAQEQLLQSERLAAIGQMVTGLAHESRNALQRAQACLDMLALDLEDQPEQLELTEKTRRALQDLHRYYEEVRNYAAPIQLDRRTVDLRRLWRSTWQDLEAIRFGRQLELVEPSVGMDLHCHIDEHRMRQVFRNIIENAIAACPDPGRLVIRCAAFEHDGHDCIEVRFQDNGPGFTLDAVESVFEPFFTTKQKGTGLGMAIARRIVDAHGGHIEAGGTIGQGAEIRLVLPRGT